MYSNAILRKRAELRHVANLVKLFLVLIMIYPPATNVEKQAVKFAVDLVTKYGFSHVIQMPYHNMARYLTERGRAISYATVCKYWKALCRLGYATSEINSRKHGYTFYLNRYALKKHIPA